MADDSEEPSPKDDPRKASRRKFAREVGSVVLGVLIALGLGEVAEAVRWQVRAARTNTAIDAELARVAGVLDERAMVQPCLDRRLDELDRLLKAARASNSLPAIAEVGRPPYRPMQAAAWDDAVSSGTLIHFSAGRRAFLSLNYPTIQSYDQDLKEEQALWAALRVMEATPGPISDDLLAEVSLSVARLRYSTMMNGLSAQETRDDIFRTGVAASYFIILDREGSRDEVAAAVQARPVCRPLSAGSPP